MTKKCSRCGEYLERQQRRSRVWEVWECPDQECRYWEKTAIGDSTEGWGRENIL